MASRADVFSLASLPGSVSSDLTSLFDVLTKMSQREKTMTERTAFVLAADVADAML